jgi:hypothetical protein
MNTGHTKCMYPFHTLHSYLFFYVSAVGPTQPPVQWVVGALSSEVKRLGREADHSPRSSAKAKNGGATPPLPHTYLWRGAYLIKPRDNLIFFNLFTVFTPNDTTTSSITCTEYMPTKRSQTLARCCLFSRRVRALRTVTWPYGSDAETLHGPREHSQ